MHISLLWASWWSNVFICATGTCFVLSQQYLGGATKKLISTKNSTLQKRLSDLAVQETKTLAPRRNSPPMLAFSNRGRCCSMKRPRRQYTMRELCYLPAQNVVTFLLEVTFPFPIEINVVGLDPSCFRFALNAVNSQSFVWFFTLHFSIWEMDQRWVASPVFALRWRDQTFRVTFSFLFSFQEATVPIADIFRLRSLGLQANEAWRQRKCEFFCGAWPFT